MALTMEQLLMLDNLVYYNKMSLTKVDKIIKKSFSS